LIEFLPSPKATVSPGQPRLLQKGFFVKFTNEWPDTLPYVKGKFFQIARTNQVNHDLSYILPSGNYRDVDFSNQVGGVNLYPENTKSLFEVALGFKKDNYQVQFYIPAGEFVNRLEQAGMVPNVASATLKYLGAFKPEDSPYEDKRILLYFLKDLEPLIARTFVDTGCDFAKVVFGLTINKCYLEEMKTPTADQLARARTVLYYSEMRW
jgi:hypothetical protein